MWWSSRFVTGIFIKFMMCQRHQVVAFYINGDPVVLIAGASFHRGLCATRFALVMKGRN